ncbi:hypothetical protein A6302_03240 [Methylobrevis pamukkalensis]|uniref:VWFA domain-containing protein n=2 Tax=Methylobrevis pamukkalensis TaxID=1439726 RepID=A0A1E3GZJ3_9HYPH|nr:hypothetical protein A6302_03240 [Methylobrevis pamukkalensis]
MIPALWLRWQGPLGLVEVVRRMAVDVPIAVVPNIRPVTSGRIDTMVRSALHGVKENILRGEGSDFHQLRDFVRGMDSRTIDWKRSARHGSLLAREMRAERNHHVVLALDNGRLMREEIEGRPRIDHQIDAALALAWAAVIGGDQIGLYAFDARPRLFLPAEPGRGAFARLRSHTAGLAYAESETNHTLGLAHLHQRLKRRSLVVVFTDFVDTTTAELLVENVTLLNRRHVVIFVTLRDAELVRLARVAPASLAEVAAAVSAEAMLKERRLVLERLSRLGVVCIETAPEHVGGRLISAYLAIKSREVI